MKKIISGKVREVYVLEDGRMVIVTTDRISAFDVILPTMITDKGKVLNALSNFWFNYTKDICANHMISSELKDMPEEFQKSEFEGRTILVKKLKMVPYEVIVRGYMFGSMYEAYKKGEPFLGHSFDKEYQQAEKLAEPIVTPSTKAAEGHDINVTLDYMKKDRGENLEQRLNRQPLQSTRSATITHTRTESSLQIQSLNSVLQKTEHLFLLMKFLLQTQAVSGTFQSMQ